MPKIKVNGINLYYEEIGSGEPLVFIPGHGGSTLLWIYQTKYFKDYYHVITIDNLEAGQSDKPDGPYSMEMLAKDLNDLLDEIRINEPVLLVGASLGGVIAQAFIHDYRYRVKKLVLSCTGVSPGGTHITIPSPGIIEKILNPGNTSEERIKTLFNIFYHPSYLKKRPDLISSYLKRKEEMQPAHAYQAQLEASVDQRPYYEWLSEIEVPTLVIHGQDDLVWPVKNAETLKEGIGDNAQLYIMKGAGHVFFQERAEEFNKKLHDFFV